jgi:hypothetical protein
MGFVGIVWEGSNELHEYLWGLGRNRRRGDGRWDEGCFVMRWSHLEDSSPRLQSWRRIA